MSIYIFRERINLNTGSCKNILNKHKQIQRIGPKKLISVYLTDGRIFLTLPKPMQMYIKYYELFVEEPIPKIYTVYIKLANY